MATIVERLGSLAVGRVEFVTAQELRVTLYPETPQATALNTGVPTGFPRVNSYVVVPNEAGAVVAVVNEVAISRSKDLRGNFSDEALIDLPFPDRTLVALPFGTLSREDDVEGKPLYKLERGVPVLPSVGDPVLLPTAIQLRSIVEAEDKDRVIAIGTAPFAADAKVWVHPDKIFGRHLAILGNTGSGKSCSVAGLVRWSLEAAQSNLRPGRALNARFIILDPNGEYSEAFKDKTIPARLYAVDATGDTRRLSVPGWLWNGQEWSAFTSAQSGVQRPLLMRALRALRNSEMSAQAIRDQAVKRYLGYFRRLTEIYADIPRSITQFPYNKNFGEMLEGIVALTHSDEQRLGSISPPATDLASAIISIRNPIERIRIARLYSSGGKSGYNDFQPNDVETVQQQLGRIVNTFPLATGPGEISEDAPVRFDIAKLPEQIHEVALASGGQAVANVEPLINRIQVMLGDRRLRPIIDTDTAGSLQEWIEELLGPTDRNKEGLAILDLSLVPSDVVHIAVAVISRLLFEALQRHAKAAGSVLPTVLVMEEAHTFVRKDVEQGSSQAAAEVCRQVFERIAREGRKFGLGLVLASQRPSELSPTVLAQCNSFLLHRIVNDVDQNLVRRLVPDALGALLGELPTLPSQQAILLGWAVSTPVLIRVRDLDHRPRSADPRFWDTWIENTGSRPNWRNIARAWEQAARPPSAGADT